MKSIDLVVSKTVEHATLDYGTDEGGYREVNFWFTDGSQLIVRSMSDADGDHALDARFINGATGLITDLP